MPGSTVLNLPPKGNTAPPVNNPNAYSTVIPDVHTSRSIGDYDSVIDYAPAGIYGIVDDDDRRMFSRAAHDLQRDVEETFNPLRPAESLQESLEAARRAAGSNEEMHAALVKLFTGDDGRQYAACATSGGSRILRHTHQGLQDISGGPQAAGGAPQVDVIELEPGDRLMLTSAHAGRIKERSSVMRRLPTMLGGGYLEARTVANRLSRNSNRSEKASAFVIDFAGDDTTTGNLAQQPVHPSRRQRVAGVIQRLRGRSHEHDPNQPDGQRKRQLGRLAVMAVGGYVAGRSHLQSRRENRIKLRNERDAARGGGRHVFSDYMAGAPLRRARQGRTVRPDGSIVPHGSSEAIPADRYYEHRGSKGRKLIVAAAVLGIAAVSWKLFEGSVTDAADGKDLGTDLLPNWFSDDGPHDFALNPLRGVDVNLFNETNLLNDDYINYVEAADKKEGLDILPRFFDGDGIDVWNGKAPVGFGWLDDEGEIMRSAALVNPSNMPPIDAPNVDVPDLPPAGDLEPTPPQIDIPAPRVPVEVVTPPVEVNTPPVDVVPEIPDTVVIDPGQGLIETLHDIGHDFDPGFTAADGQEALEQIRDTAGDEFFDIVGHDGPSTYLVGDDLRIAAPGELQWDAETQAMVRDILRQIAAA